MCNKMMNYSLFHQIINNLVQNIQAEERGKTAPKARLAQCFFVRNITNMYPKIVQEKKKNSAKSKASYKYFNLKLKVIITRILKATKGWVFNRLMHIES